MQTEVKFGLRSEALANITKAFSQTNATISCFNEAGKTLP
jgi:hypothetical protein